MEQVDITKTIQPGTGKRDAIHVAIIPGIMDHDMMPGTHVGKLLDGSFSATASKRIGVVSPFIQNMVKKGECCYIFLYPGSVIGLRHDWSHPDLPEEGELENMMRNIRKLEARNLELEARDTDFEARNKALVSRVNDLEDDDVSQARCGC